MAIFCFCKPTPYVITQGEKLTAGTTWHSAAMLNTLRFGIIEVYSCIVCHFQTLSTGKAGEPHKEVGRPPRGGDRRQPWVQGTSPGYKVQAVGIR